MKRWSVLLLLVVACSKDGDKPASTSPRDAVLEAWKAAKLVPAAPPVPAPATVTFGKDCQSATIEGLELLICNFATPAEAKAAEDPGLGWVGAATGASQAHGAALIVVADRKKADPSGRTINRLMKLAPN